MDHRHIRAVDRTEARFRRYLGDGVYAAYDGFGVWLTAENGLPQLTRSTLSRASLSN